MDKLTNGEGGACPPFSFQGLVTIRWGAGFQIVYNLELLFTAKLAGVRSPRSVARCHEIGDHATYISLLGRVVVGARMISGDRHGPGLMPAVEILKKLGGIFHVSSGIEHLLDGPEFGAMEVMVDLHTADIDQLDALAAGVVEDLDRTVTTGGKDCLALDIHGVGLKRSLASRLRQADGVQDALRNAVAGCSSAYLTLTGPCIRLRLRYTRG